MLTFTTTRECRMSEPKEVAMVKHLELKAQETVLKLIGMVPASEPSSASETGTPKPERVLRPHVSISSGDDTHSDLEENSGWGATDDLSDLEKLMDVFGVLRRMGNVGNQSCSGPGEL